MNRLKALVLAVVGVLTLSSCDFNIYELPLPGGADTGDQPMTLEVEFNDVLDLVPQSSVKVNDVTVGKVTGIDLDEYQALVTVEIKNDVELPANAGASIRQTSLLGEKFVELEAPSQGGQGSLESGATIPLERTSRNPEVEEVLGALALLLNGGGVAQLKTISNELGNALEGREGSAKSVLRQLRQLTGQLDDRKGDIVSAIESLDRLARSANKQEETINAALDELPSAVKSIDSQREDLVKMLQALDRLSEVGVRVINASKGATIKSLQRLDPVLTQLANAGNAFADSFSVLPTYPFVDQVVGRDPQVARQVKTGDYTNLDIKLDLDLQQLLSAQTACTGVKLVKDELENASDGNLTQLTTLLEQIAGGSVGDLCDRAAQLVDRCANTLAGQGDALGACRRLLGPLQDLLADLPQLKQQLCSRLPNAPLLGTVCGNNNDGDNDGPKLPVDPTNPLGGVTGSLPGVGGDRDRNNSGNGGGRNGGGGNLTDGLGVNRAPFGETRRSGPAAATTWPSLSELDPELVELLVPGVLAR